MEATIQSWLNSSVGLLEDAGIATARLDCLVLLEDLLGKDKAYILAHPERQLNKIQLETLSAQVNRRLSHEPLAYIRCKTEFYGREFKVSKDTLEPRPETETMISQLLDLVESRKSKVECIVDVGTGSGCIAITVKLEMPELKVVATDVSIECLKIAEQNAKKLGANVTFIEAGLLDFPANYHLPPTNYIAVMANLPYVPDSHTINHAAMHEPKLAIFGGPDGLDLNRQLFDQIATKSQFDGIKYVLTECLPFQHEQLTQIAKVAGYRLQQTEDFIQLFERELG